MLTLGVRHGRGFDNETLAKLMAVSRQKYEFDVLIVGTNPGGMVCAKEMSKFGKKTAIINWRIPTPGEEEGHDLDLEEMAESLDLDEESIRERVTRILEEEDKRDLISAVKVSGHGRSKVAQVTLRAKREPLIRRKWIRKVRKSKMDLKNSITNMATEGRRFMHQMAQLEDNKRKFQKMSWGKMMDYTQEHILKRNWTLLTDFIKERISIFNGYPIFINDHTVRVILKNGDERLLTAEIIIAAVEIHNSFPKDVEGALDFGINCDDFFRLGYNPGRTLVVGAGSRGLECAGILTSFSVPVTLIYKGELLKNCDSDLTEMITNDLSIRGVVFMPRKALKSIRKSDAGNCLVVELMPLQGSSDTLVVEIEEFDTVLFTMKEKFQPSVTGKELVRAECERLTGKLYPLKETSVFQSIIAIRDQPDNVLATEMAGYSICKALFSDADEIEPKPLIPNVILTPLEYASVGIGEAECIIRLGADCTEAFAGFITTTDIIPNKALLRDDTCYVKCVLAKGRGIVLGLHLIGKDAAQLLSAMLRPVTTRIALSDLPQAIQNLWEPGEHSIETDFVLNEN